MKTVRNSTYQENNIEYMNQTIVNLENMLDEITKQSYKLQNQAKIEIQ